MNTPINKLPKPEPIKKILKKIEQKSNIVRDEKQINRNGEKINEKQIQKKEIQEKKKVKTVKYLDHLFSKRFEF